MNSIEIIREYLVEAIAQEEGYLDDFLSRRETLHQRAKSSVNRHGWTSSAIHELHLESEGGIAKSYSTLCALRRVLEVVESVARTDGGES